MLGLYLAILYIANPAFGVECITLADVESAQNELSQAIVSIGESYTAKKDYQALAKQLVGKLYPYDLGVVLFAPTKASKVPFRPTFDEALSHFVGGVIPEGMVLR